ncbi:hypothetical protein, partial [Blastomonas sp.]|uniref:hypothetical protein n=1 Tax=Blastomonas sp. TaxID=1909299 RepID=UPI00359381D8
LKNSFDMLRDGQARVMENMNSMNPMAKMPGFEVMQKQQVAFMKAMSAWPRAAGTTGPEKEPEAKSDDSEDLEAIKRQLAELQEKLSKLK